ncbi:MAG: hypothetical protein ACI9KD_002388 [Congregibacter sp.]|jgi:hypothetical protein
MRVMPGFRSPVVAIGFTCNRRTLGVTLLMVLTLWRSLRSLSWAPMPAHSIGRSTRLGLQCSQGLQARVDLPGAVHSFELQPAVFD